MSENAVKMEKVKDNLNSNAFTITTDIPILFCSEFENDSNANKVTSHNKVNRANIYSANSIH